MRVIQKKEGKVHIFSLNGRFDAYSAEKVEAKLNFAVLEGTSNLLIDLSGTDYISSAGLKVFLAVAKKLKKKEGQIRLCCLQPDVKEVFDITEFTHIFKIYKTVEEGLSSFELLTIKQKEKIDKIPSSITLQASLKHLSKINNFVRMWAQKAGLSSHSEKDLLLAVEEVYVNIVNYAYPKSKGKMSIYCDINGEELILKMKDDGLPFNPLQFPEPELSSHLEERKVGGLGIFLMQKLVDRVYYERKGNSNLLTLLKKKIPDFERKLDLEEI